MTLSNPIWGEERIAIELLLKLGIRESPRTVCKYMPKRLSEQPRIDQHWSTPARAFKIRPARFQSHHTNIGTFFLATSRS
jgi:hypothetical protein